MKWVIEPQHSSVEFSAKHMIFSTVRGSFKQFEVDIDLDDSNLENSRVEARIDVASLDTNQEMRKQHLLSPDFLDVQNYPEITFKSTKISKTGEGEYDMTGDLTIRGTTRPVTLQLEGGQAKDPYGNLRWAFTAETTINRKDWGLAWNVALETGGVMVGEKIKIELAVELITQEAFQAMMAAFQKRATEAAEKAAQS
ncbi:MAG TPA: YceI family protein [Chloroflexia bacterium]|nr:YceI family protein [Chloroflexia bacterium]